MAEAVAARLSSVERRMDALEKRVDEKLDTIKSDVSDIKVTAERTAIIVERIGEDMERGRAQFAAIGDTLDEHGRRIAEMEGTLSGRNGLPGIVRKVDALEARSLEMRGQGQAHARVRILLQIAGGALSGAVATFAAVWALFQHPR